MKTIFSTTAIALLALTVTACGSDTEASAPITVTETVTTEAGAVESTTEAASAEDELVDISSDGTVEGQIGYGHGIDCPAPGECAFGFTVESMEVIDACDGYIMSHTSRPEGTRLLKSVILVEAQPSEGGWDPSQFPIWSTWSAVDQSGINQVLPKSDWCYNDNPADAWQNEIRVGDTERRIHYMDIPDDTASIRLTENDTDARWEWVAP